MTIKKITNGYQVDVRPQGREGRRFRKTFGTRTEASAYEKHIITKYSTAEPWQNKRDRRRFDDLRELWFTGHGTQLKDGAGRNKKLKFLIELLGNPRADKFTTQDFTRFRSERLATVSANTVNHDQSYLRAMFNELKRLGEWHGGNPFESVRRVKIDEPELTYLDKAQIKTLLSALDASTSHARITARVCLATGARWGEACQIRPEQIKNGSIQFSMTKSGKNRSVPISDTLAALVLAHAPLVDGLNTFKRTIEKLNWKLPRGQSTHILRHTFASHYMMNGGDILTLQKILGHSSLTMTIRYAHLAPDHLNSIRGLNPLEN